MMMFLRVVLVAVLFHNSVQKLNEFVQFRKENLAKEKQAYFTKTFLQLYTGFSLMFHVENCTSDYIDYLLKIVHEDIFGEIIILNQDTLSSISFQQRKGSPFLHLVFLNNIEKYESFLNSPGCLISSDVVVFMLINNNNSLNQEFSIMPRLDWAGNVVIFNIYNKSISLYNICFYCGILTGKLHHLQTSSASRLKVDKVELLPRNFNNFNNHLFKIGYVDSFPFMLCEHSKYIKENEVSKQCIQASGLEMGILRLISKKLNFTYWLIEYTHSLSNSDEDINKEGSNILDFIIGGLSITVARAPKMSFTSTLAFEPCTFLYIPRKSRLLEVFDNLKPFHRWLWVTVLLATLLFSGSLYVCVRLLSDNIINRTFSSSKCLKICFKSIIEQADNGSLGLGSFKKYYSPYVVLLLWWFASTIFATAYKSKMWAISIKNYHEEPSNLQELLDNGYEIVVDSQSMSIIEDLLTETEPMLVEAKKKLILKNHTCETLLYAITNKAAMLDEHATLQYHALVRCSEILTQSIYSKLRITRIPLRHTTHSWPLKMGAPYKSAFDTLIGRIDAAGLQNKWKSDSISVLRNKYDKIPYSQPTAMERTDEEKKFLQGFISSFAFYIFGNCLAIIFFIIEIAFTKQFTIFRN